MRAPFSSLIQTFGTSIQQVTSGLPGFIRTQPYDPVSVQQGAMLLGLPFNQDLVQSHAVQGQPVGAHVLEQAERCVHHPLASPLFAEEQPVEFKTTAQQLRQLSTQLFSHRKRPVHIFHVILESMGSDDIQAVNPYAFKFVAPFLSQLYQQAHEPSTHTGYTVIAAEHLYQAGARTSQALSATFCGMGTTPYHLSVVRDLGLLPLRCLPDVLLDAGFKTSIAHNIAFSFENMEYFFRFHGVHLATRPDWFPKNSVMGGWGVSDRVLFKEVLRQQQQQQPSLATESEYHIVLSLSGHHPYEIPRDMHAELRQDVTQLLQQSAHFDEDSKQRLLNVAYVDDALREFVESLKQHYPTLDADLIVVIQGDHNSGEFAPWPLQPQDHERRVGRIPFIILLPQFEQAAWQQSVKHLNQEWQRQILSENDIPRMMLELLHAYPGLQQIPKRWAFHTLGGQMSSPDYKHPTRSDSRPLASVNGHSNLILINQDRQLIYQEPVHTLDLTALAEQQHQTNPEITHSAYFQPAIALWSWLMNDYARFCFEPPHKTHSM